jgi:purine-binding chemotaxis protein CheW
MSILHVVFKVAGTDYALPAEEVLQMESYSGATPIPGAAAHVAGIVQVRGRVVPVVDLRARFGLEAAERTLDSRLVIGNDSGRSVALLVDSAREVVKLEAEQVEPPPAMVADEAQGFVKAVARLGDRLLMLIDFKKVIGEVQLHA